MTANYHPHEQQILRELARTKPDEARILHELKARLGATIITDNGERTYIYVWGNNARRAQLKGRRCTVEAEGAKNTVLIRFVDNGERVTTSRRALRAA